MFNKNNFYTLFLIVLYGFYTTIQATEFNGKTVKDVAVYLKEALETNNIKTIKFAIDQVNKKSSPDLKNNSIFQKFINIASDKIIEINLNNENIQKLQYAYLKPTIVNILNGKNFSENFSIIQLIQTKIDLEDFLNKEEEEKETIIEEIEFEYPDFIYNELESEEKINNFIELLTIKITNKFINLTKKEQINLLKTSSNEVSLEIFNNLSLTLQKELYPALKSLDDTATLSSLDEFITYQKELFFERIVRAKTIYLFNEIINDAKNAELPFDAKEKLIINERFHELENAEETIDFYKKRIQELENKLRICNEKN